MIKFSSRKTATVFAFLILSLSILIYKLPFLTGVLQIVTEEMSDGQEDAAAKAANVYGFKVKDLDGNEVDMEKYRYVAKFKIN